MLDAFCGISVVQKRTSLLNILVAPTPHPHTEIHMDKKQLKYFENGFSESCSDFDFAGFEN